MEEKTVSVMVSVMGSEKGEGEQVRLVTSGKLTHNEKGYLLKYRETQPEGDDYQEIDLLMDGKRVTMNRTGGFATSMVFEKGYRFEGIYATPYGDLDMALYATQVECNLSMERGMVYLQYQLDIQGQYAAMHDLHIKYAQKHSKVQ